MSAPEQRPAHRFRCGPLVTFQQMPVHVLGDGDAGMTEHLGDGMQRRPWASISEAPEWRSSCECQCPRPARSHSRETAEMGNRTSG